MEGAPPSTCVPGGHVGGGVVSRTGSSDAIEAARCPRGQTAGAGRREGHHRSGRHSAAPGVTLAPVEAVPLDAEHERLALLYLAELLAPLFSAPTAPPERGPAPAGSDGSRPPEASKRGGQGLICPPR